MPDFFPTNCELTIGEIVTLTGAKPRAGVQLERRIGNIAPLDTARASDITFFDNAKYLDALKVTRAGACLLAPRFQAAAPDGLAVLVAAEPYRAFVAVARALFPSALRPSSLFGAGGRAAGAGAGILLVDFRSVRRVHAAGQLGAARHLERRAARGA